MAEIRNLDNTIRRKRETTLNKDAVSFQSMTINIFCFSEFLTIQNDHEGRSSPTEGFADRGRQGNTKEWASSQSRNWRRRIAWNYSGQHRRLPS